MKVQNDIIQFIDYVVNCISNGKYIYYQLSYIPPEKVENKGFLAKLDSKIKEKYQTDKNKNERLTMRRQDKARFIAVRYNNILIILKTEGDSEIAVNEHWEDIRKKKINLEISKYTTYTIGLGQAKASKGKTLGSKITVSLGANTYNAIKLSCLDAIRYKKSIPKLYYEFNKINGYNGWSGINKQKMQLRDYLVKEVCKEFGKNKKEARKIFRINTFRAKAQKDLDKAFIEEATENGHSPPVAEELQV